MRISRAAGSGRGPGAGSGGGESYFGGAPTWMISDCAKIFVWASGEINGKRVVSANPNFEARTTLNMPFFMFCRNFRHCYSSNSLEVENAFFHSVKYEEACLTISMKRLCGVNRAEYCKEHFLCIVTSEGLGHSRYQCTELLPWNRVMITIRQLCMGVWNTTFCPDIIFFFLGKV